MPKVKIVCANCGSKLIRFPSKVYRRCFCSNKCRNQWLTDNEEHKKRVRESVKGTHPKGIKHPLYGKKRSVATLQRISEGTCRGMKKHGASAKISAREKGKDNHNYRGGRFKKCETCGNLFWVSPSADRTHRNCPECAWRLRKPTLLEQKLDRILQHHFPNEWRYVGDGKSETKIGGRIPDFINVNGKKAVIEVNGEYWHQNVLEDARQINHYRTYGFNCLVIWQREVEELGMKRLVSKIKKFQQEV